MNNKFFAILDKIAQQIIFTLTLHYTPGRPPTALQRNSFTRRLCPFVLLLIYTYLGLIFFHIFILFLEQCLIFLALELLFNHFFLHHHPVSRHIVSRLRTPIESSTALKGSPRRVAKAHHRDTRNLSKQSLSSSAQSTEAVGVSIVEDHL